MQRVTHLRLTAPSHAPATFNATASCPGGGRMAWNRRCCGVTDGLCVPVCTQVRAQEVKEEVHRLEIEQGEQDQAFEEEKAKRDAELLEELKKEARAKEAAAMEATKVRAFAEQRGLSPQQCLPEPYTHSLWSQEGVRLQAS